MPIYKVQAPNGKVYNIEGPEGADENTILQTAQQLHDRDEMQRLRKDYGPGLLGVAGQGIKRGAQQLGVTFGDVIPAMVGKKLGFEEYAKRQMGEAEQTQQEIEATNPAYFKSYKEVETPYHALQFGSEVIGEQLPNIATSLIPGLGAGQVAKRAALASVGKSLASEAAEKGLAGEAAQAFVTEGMKRAAPQIAAKQTLGTNVGVFLGSYAQNAPEIFQNIYEKTGQLDVGVSLLFGAGSAALDSILPAQLAKQISGPLKVGVVEKILEKSGMDKSLLRSVSAGILKGSVGEGLTEGAQEAISIAAEKFVANHPQIFKSKEWDRIMESSVRGAIAGGGFGAVGGAAERGRTLSDEAAKQREAAAAEQAQQEEAAAAEQAKQEEFERYKNATQGSWAEQFDEDVQRQEQGQTDADIEAQAQEVVQTGQGSLDPRVQARANEILREQQAGARQKAAAEADKKINQGTLFDQFDEDIQKQEQTDADIEAQAQEVIQTGQGSLDPEVQARVNELLRERQTTTRQEEFEKYKNAVQGSWTEQFDEGLQKQDQEREAAVKDVLETGQQDLFDESINKEAEARIKATQEQERLNRYKKIGVNGTVIGSTKDELKAFGKAIGVGNTAKILRPEGPFAGKDLSNPEQSKEVVDMLTALANSKDAPAGAATKIEKLLSDPLFQIREMETQNEPTTQTETGGFEPSPGATIGSAESEREDTGGSRAPDIGGLGPTGYDVDVSNAGERGVDTSLEEQPEPTPKPTTKADRRVTELLKNRLRTAAEDAGVDPNLVSYEGLEDTPAHNYLKLPTLLNKYFTAYDVANAPDKGKGVKDRVEKNKVDLSASRKAILQLEPKLEPILDRLAAAPTETREDFVTGVNKEALDEFDSVMGQRIKDAKVKAKKKPKAKASQTTAGKPKLSEEEFFRNVEKIAGKGVFHLPKHQGPNLTEMGKALAKSGNFKGLVQHLKHVSDNPNVQRILNKIAGLGLKTKVKIGQVENDQAGSYDPITDTITLSPEHGLNEHTVLHETIHAAISHVLNSPNLPVTKQLSELFHQLQNQLGGFYGGQNMQEFAAELVSNPQFQALLKTIKAPRSENMFQRFMRVLAEFFGFRKGTNAYDAGLKLINDAIDISADVEPSLSDMLFLGTPNTAREGLDIVGRIGQEMPSLTGRAIEGAKNYISNLPRNLVSLGSGLLRLDNLNTIYKKELPSIQKLLSSLELRHGMEEKMVKVINDNYKFFEKVQKTHPAQFRAMENMAYDARLEQVDPLDGKFLDKPGLTDKQRSEYKKLSNIYNKLPPDVRKTYRMIRDSYSNAINEYEKILFGDPDKKIPGIVEGSVAAKLKGEFQARKRQIAYIPFLRKGDFWVEYDINGERAASAFESIRERERFINEVLKPKGIKSKPYQTIQKASFKQGDLPPTNFIVQVMNSLNKKGASQDVKDTIYQSYLSLFPAESLAKNFMKSENVLGMERDIVRGYGETMIKWARKLARSKYNPEIDRAVRAIATEAENNGTPEIVAIAENIEKQSSFFHNPTYDKLTTASTTLSYFTFIAGNISSALVNLSTLPMFTLPMLGARYGFDSAFMVMPNATKMATNYSLHKTIPKQYQKLFDTLNDHAQLEHTLAREVLEGRRETTSDFLGVKAKIMDLVSKPFHVTEVMNRGTTAIAAYELALKGNPSLGIKPMNEQDAINYAVDTVKQINTSGLSSTAPLYMQHPLGRVFFTFKSFIWNQAFAVARAFHQAAKGENANVRKEALRQLFGIYGTAFAFAGIKGLPFMGATSVLATMVNALLGDDDEPYDFDVMMQEWSNLMLYKGLPNYALNIELSNRVGVANDLIYRDDPRSVAEHGYVLTAMKQAFGPAGAFVFDAGRGAQLMSEGHTYRGIEAMMPSFIKNGMKAMRFANEGALTLKGQPIVEDLSAYNLMMQAIGFSPANLTRTYEEIGMLKEFERELLAKRSKLLTKYDMAIKSGDYELLQETREDIADFNKLRINPKARITQDTLNRSQKARKAAEEQMIHGIRFNKALRPELDKLIESFED